MKLNSEKKLEFAERKTKFMSRSQTFVKLLSLLLLTPSVLWGLCPGQDSLHQTYWVQKTTTPHQFFVMFDQVSYEKQQRFPSIEFREGDTFDLVRCFAANEVKNIGTGTITKKNFNRFEALVTPDVSAFAPGFSPSSLCLW
jgi:hypothetical protein